MVYASVLLHSAILEHHSDEQIGDTGGGRPGSKYDDLLLTKAWASRSASWEVLPALVPLYEFTSSPMLRV